MAIYQFECQHCGKGYEGLHNYTDKVQCPHCGREMKKIPSSPARTAERNHPLNERGLTRNDNRQQNDREIWAQSIKPACAFILSRHKLFDFNFYQV